jgi:hypothetical protein
MTSVFGHLCGVDICLVCRLPEQIPGRFGRFVRGDVDVVVCEACHADYCEQTGELITETMRRSGADPRALIWWATKQ